MDEGKGGQTRSLQGRDGSNQRIFVEMGRKRKNGITRARAARRSRKGWGGQKAHDGALAMAWPRRAELCRKQWWRY